MLCPKCSLGYVLFGDKQCERCHYLEEAAKPKENPKECLCTWDDQGSVLL